MTHPVDLQANIFSLGMFWQTNIIWKEGRWISKWWWKLKNYEIQFIQCDMACSVLFYLLDVFKHLQRFSYCEESQSTQFNCKLLSVLSPCLCMALAIKRGNTHLVAEIHISISGKKQWHHVHVAILRGKMYRGNTLPGYSIGISTIFQQCSCNVHLVFLGSYVQWSIAILSTEHTSL